MRRSRMARRRAVRKAKRGRGGYKGGGGRGESAIASHASRRTLLRLHQAWITEVLRDDSLPAACERESARALRADAPYVMFAAGLRELVLIVEQHEIFIPRVALTYAPLSHCKEPCMAPCAPALLSSAVNN